MCNNATCGCLQVALTVFYAAEGGANYYANTFFNRTIDIVETPKWVDTELLFLWLLLLAAVSVGGELQRMCRKAHVNSSPSAAC